MAAFPRAYAVILTALYLPLALMLLGLIWRGVAFEFRFKADDRHKPFWDKAFMLGSITATFFQGASLGAFLDGFPVEGNRYLGGPMDWLTPFSVFVGCGLIVAYALLGATWLVIKTEGALQRRMIRLARPAALALLGTIGIVSLWTPLVHAEIAARWFSLPNLILFSPVPLLVVLATWLLLRQLRHEEPGAAPFLLALGLLFPGYSGLGISLWPNILPPGISIWEAAAPPQSMGFALVGALLIIPMILGYTAWSYYVFRGKVKPGEGYH
ncbi:cytochrome d ubiquinol oxidase subunit II [Rhodobacter sp.]